MKENSSIVYNFGDKFKSKLQNIQNEQGDAVMDHKSEEAFIGKAQGTLMYCTITR